MTPDPLNPKQEHALALVLSGKPDGEIAQTLGVGRQTVNHWRNHDDDFRAALAAQREALRDGTADALQALTHQAIRVLTEALNNENVYVRLKAAALILKASETRVRAAREKGVDRQAIERQIVIASLTEALTEMGRVG
jgi:transposase